MPKLDSTFKHVKSHWKKRVRIYVNRCTTVFEDFKYSRHHDLYYLLELVESLYDLGIRGEVIYAKGVEDDQLDSVLQDIMRDLRKVEVTSKELANVCEKAGMPTQHAMVYINKLASKQAGEAKPTYEDVLKTIEEE